MPRIETPMALSDYLAAPYPFNVVAESDGGYFVSFPDLPGCMTQVGRIEEVGPAADEIRELWIETAFEQGIDIPEPSTPAGYSGKFVLRLPRSLHRTLAGSAEREGVSLNQYATSLLAGGNALAAVERRLDALENRLDLVHDRLGVAVSGMPAAPTEPGLRIVGGPGAVAARWCLRSRRRAAAG